MHAAAFTKFLTSVQNTLRTRMFWQMVAAPSQTDLTQESLRRRAATSSYIFEMATTHYVHSRSGLYLASALDTGHARLRDVASTDTRFSVVFFTVNGML